jgi:hypothetical protein
VPSGTRTRPIAGAARPTRAQIPARRPLRRGRRDFAADRRPGQQLQPSVTSGPSENRAGSMRGGQGAPARSRHYDRGEDPRAPCLRPACAREATGSSQMSSSAHAPRRSSAATTPQAGGSGARGGVDPRTTRLSQTPTGISATAGGGAAGGPSKQPRRRRDCFRRDAVTRPAREAGCSCRNRATHSTRPDC